ncbi:cytidylyltransferase domain-containing protein [Elusimicrobiota bacterium]
MAVIPARGGSRGVPGKNIRAFAGRPLIAHTIAMAKMCPEIDRIIVSTDSENIAKVARESGAEVPFMRPAELARDDTPMWPVLRHALDSLDKKCGEHFTYLLLLQPTSPCRLPQDISGALRCLESAPEADGIMGVSQPDFSPVWQCVTEKDGWMHDLFEDGACYNRRQDAPNVYYINGCLYIWRTDFIRRSASEDYACKGKLLAYKMPDERAVDIDNEHQFRRAELMVEHGLIDLPWLTQRGTRVG